MLQSFLKSVLKNFYVLEGIDGAGKSLITSLIQTMWKTSPSLFVTREPTNTIIGQIARQGFQKKLNPLTVALLFSADRSEHLFSKKDGIYKMCHQGVQVVCDRYFFSSLVYQGNKVSEETLLEINKYFPLPQHVFFLDTDPKLCLQRIQNRAHRDYVEFLPVLKKARYKYMQLFQKFSPSTMMIHHIDGSKDANFIAKEIISIILSADK